MGCGHSSIWLTGGDDCQPNQAEEQWSGLLIRWGFAIPDPLVGKSDHIVFVFLLSWLCGSELQVSLSLSPSGIWKIKKYTHVSKCKNDTC
jgi:hypothetical protein